MPRQAEPETGYGTSCAPATLSAGSTLLAIDAGEERTGIDIHLQASRVVRMEGVLLGMPSDSAQHFQAVLVNADENMADWDVLHSSTDHDGRFRFAGVLPGSYTLICTLHTFPAVGTDVPSWGHHLGRRQQTSR